MKRKWSASDHSVMKSTHMRARTVVCAISAVSTVGIIIGLYIVGTTQHDVVKEVIIEVDYFDHWNLTLTSNGIETQYSRFGKGSIILWRGGVREWQIFVHCVKLDSLQGLLIVRVKDVYGDVLKHAFTNEPFGDVNITLEL